MSTHDWSCRWNEFGVSSSNYRLVKWDEEGAVQKAGKTVYDKDHVRLFSSYLKSLDKPFRDGRKKQIMPYFPSGETVTASNLRPLVDISLASIFPPNLAPHSTHSKHFE